MEQAALAELHRQTCGLSAAPCTSYWSYIQLTRATHRVVKRKERLFQIYM